MIVETLPWELVAQIVGDSMPLIARLAALNRDYYSIFGALLYRLEGETARFSDPWTSCLLWAAMHDRVETLQAAKRHGFDLNGPPADTIVVPSPHSTGAGSRNLMHLHLSYRDIEEVHVSEMPVKTPLYMAARHSSYQALGYLLENGANVHQPYSQMTSRHGNANDRAVRYPLYTALFTVKDDFKAAAMLLAHGAYAITPSSTLVEFNGRLRDRKLTSALAGFVRSFKVDRHGRPCLAYPGETVRGRDKLGIIRLLYGPRTPFGNVMGPLQFAVLAQDAELVRILLAEPDFGVPGFTAQHYARMVTPLELAVKRDSDEIVEILMQTPLLTQPSAKDILEWATNRNDGARLDQLVATIPDRAGVDAALKDTALLCNAVTKGNDAVVAWLSRRPDTDPMMLPSGDLDCGLNLAITHGKVDILQLLLENPRTRDYIRTLRLERPSLRPGTPLSNVAAWPVEADVRAMVDLLVAAGVPVNCAPLAQATPLYQSLAHGNFGAACAILAHGADVAPVREEDDSFSALHYCLMHHRAQSHAAGQMQTQAVKTLLLAGCEVDRDHGPRRNLRGSADTFLPYVTQPRFKMYGTPLFFAATYSRSPGCVDALLHAGARVDSRVHVTSSKYAPARRRTPSSLFSGILQTVWGTLKHDGCEVVDFGDLRAILRSLLRAGARLDDRCDAPWGSGLDWACWLCLKTAFPQFLTILLQEATAANVSAEHVWRNIEKAQQSQGDQEDPGDQMELDVVDLLTTFLEIAYPGGVAQPEE